MVIRWHWFTWIIKTLNVSLHSKLATKYYNETFDVHITYMEIYILIPEMLGRFLNLNKIKTKRLSNHMSQYFIHNRT